MTSDTPDAKAQTTEQLVAEVVAYLRAEADFNRSWTDGRRKAYGDRRGYIARRIELAEERERWADAILAITDPQTVRKAALEEAAKDIEDRGEWPECMEPCCPLRPKPTEAQREGGV